MSSPPASSAAATRAAAAPDGSVSVVTRGWADPQNREALDRTTPIEPGQNYAITVSMQPDDYVFAPGHRLGVVVLSSDHDFTLRPLPGTELTVNPARSTLSLPIVGGLR